MYAREIRIDTKICPCRSKNLHTWSLTGGNICLWNNPLRRIDCRETGTESDMWIFGLGRWTQLSADAASTPPRYRHRQAWIGTAALLVVGLGLPVRALRAQARDVPVPAIPPHSGGLQFSASRLMVFTIQAPAQQWRLSIGPDESRFRCRRGRKRPDRVDESGQHSTFSLVYTPSYTGRIRYSSWDALNHNLSLNATRRLAPRWNLGFSVSGDLSNFEGFLFSPTVFSNVASVPANFADLSAAILGQSSTNTQLASILNSAPVVESPARTLLYGERMFTSATRASLSYSYSRRFSVNFSVGAGRSQHLGESQNSLALAQSPYLLPTTTSGNASLGFSYSLSPRTQFGATVATSRVASDLYDGYSTSSTASLGRKLGRHWFLQIHGGVGLMNPLREISVQSNTSSQSTGLHPVAGGSLGFRTSSHTFLGSYDRTVSDSYGVGATTTSTSSATWRWSRPGVGWWLEGSFSWQVARRCRPGRCRPGYIQLAGHGELGKQLGAHVALITQYVYLNYSGRLETSLYSQSQSAMRVSIVWTRMALPRLSR